jgi:glycine hydroxymethyltransferase
MKEDEMKEIARLIDKVLSNVDNEKVISDVKWEVEELIEAFPLYKDLRKLYNEQLKS